MAVRSGAAGAVRALAVQHDGCVLELLCSDGRRLRFHALWLLDNAPDPAAREGSQRAQSLSVLDPGVRLVSARLVANGRIDLRLSARERIVHFDIEWLLRHAYDRACEPERQPGWVDGARTLWQRDVAAALPVSRYPDLMHDDEALAQWLAMLRRFGVARAAHGPADPAAPLALVARFGFVRETNYGRSFDVRVVPEPDNLAYTALGLEAHTDNPYRDPPPSAQLLYCIRNSASGGESFIVDGFMAARRLQRDSPDDFKLLSRYRARFQYAATPSVRLAARKPMIELAADGELVAVRLNHRSCGPITDVPFAEMMAYYAAYRRFAAIIAQPSMNFGFALEPGECFVLDNSRVLHGRSAYTSAAERWLVGCYPDLDGAMSTLSVLEGRSRSRQAIPE